MSLGHLCTREFCLLDGEPRPCLSRGAPGFFNYLRQIMHRTRIYSGHDYYFAEERGSACVGVWANRRRHANLLAAHKGVITQEQLGPRLAWLYAQWIEVTEKGGDSTCD